MLTTAAQSSPRLFCSQTSASFPLQIQVSSDHSLVSHSTKEREKKKRKSKRARKSKSEKLRLKKKSQTYTIPEVSSLKTRKAISVQFSIENSETKKKLSCDGKRNESKWWSETVWKWFFFGLKEWKTVQQREIGEVDFKFRALVLFFEIRILGFGFLFYFYFIIFLGLCS